MMWGSSSRKPNDSVSGLIIHNLYVLVVGGPAHGPNDQKSRDLTFAILEYIRDHIPIFTEMGIKVRVHKIKKSDLSNPQLVQAMKSRGITSLPALTTPNNTYVGNRLIEDVYEHNIQEYKAWKRQGIEEHAGIAPEDDLVSFYRSEMSAERAAEDNDRGEDSIGEGGDILDSYRVAMQRRESRNPRTSGGPVAPTREPSTHIARPPRRPNNISSGSSNDTMAGQTFGQAFTSEDIDSEEIDTGGSSQDDLMENAYWTNQESSM